MITVETVHTYFNYFYRKKYKDKSFALNKSATTQKHSESFLKLIDKAYGDIIDNEFLFRYFLFQFTYWEQVKFTNTSSFNQGVQLSFIIGKKAFERFQNRNSLYDWQLEKSPFVKAYGINKGDLITSIHKKHKFVVKRGIDTEAPIKLAAYNTKEGFKNCVDYSTLYNHKSKICEGCSFQVECKKLLKVKYPSLFIDRNY